jgi:predicted permease
MIQLCSYDICDLCAGQVCSRIDLIFLAEAKDTGNKIVGDGNMPLVLICTGPSIARAH